MKKTDRWELPMFLCAAALLLILLVSHNYNDLLMTTRHGINFWDILLDGNFFAFYDINNTVSGNSVYTVEQGCAYNILVYIVFAVWNLPLYLLERFANVDVMNSISCLVYAKLLPVTAMVFTAVIIKKMLETMKVSAGQHKLLLYLYVTSSLIVSVVFITGQYDTISLIFQLLGVYAFIKGQDKMFVFWFGIAFCFKYFAAVIFLPLLVIRHKKIFQWIKNLILLVIPWILTNIPFFLYRLLTAGSSSAVADGDQMAAGMLKNMIFSSNIGACLNLFILSYAAIILWCYLQRSDSDSAAYKSIWVCMISYAAFFGLMNAYPYWSVLIAPFVILVIAIAPRHLYLSMILETIGTAALVFLNMMRYNWVYFGHTLKPMIWPHILSGTQFDVSYNGSLIYHIILRLHDISDIHAIINSIFVAATVALAFITFPAKANPCIQQWPEGKEYHDILFVRFAVTAMLCLLPILAVFL